MSRTLRPTIRSSMWSTMPTPWRQPMSAARSSRSTRPSRSPFSATGTPCSKVTVTVSGSSGASSGRVTSWKTSSSGACVEVLDPLALGRAAPEVVVDRVRRRLGAALDRDAVLARVGDLLLAAHLPAADRRDDLELGRERRDGRLDADLVVALARAAVGDRVAAVLARVVDGELGDQRPAERREERVAEAVDGVRLDRRRDEVVRELLARVDDLGGDGAELQRLALDDVVVLARLAEVDRQRDDLRLVLVLDPLEHHARVEAARVEQEDLVHLAGLGEVAGGAGVAGVGGVGHVAGESRKTQAGTGSRSRSAPRRAPPGPRRSDRRRSPRAHDARRD